MEHNEANPLIFNKLCELACELEDVGPIHPRVQKRLANAFDRIIEKCLAINFSYEFPDMDYVKHTLYRHGARGVRDFIPQ